MPKTRLLMDFNLPEDREDFEIQTHARDMVSAIHEILQYLRNQEKYHDVPDTLEKIREKVHEIINEHDISHLV